MIEAAWVGNGTDSSDWWQIVVPALPAGTSFRYKIGSARQQGYDGNAYWVSWPGAASNISTSAKMMGVWQVTNVNAATIQYRPHNDYGATRTGLADGFHLVSARAFLQRSGAASVYNTCKQTFYLDAETPRGYVQWPANDGDTLTFRNTSGTALRISGITPAAISLLLIHLKKSRKDFGQTAAQKGEA